MRKIGIIEPAHIRLTNAINIRGLSATELCDMTGITKSSLSHYMNGRYKPKQDRLVVLAKALKVTPEYLMGFDVPMEQDDFESAKLEERLNIYFGKLVDLDEADREFILKQIDLLSERQERSKK